MSERVTWFRRDGSCTAMVTAVDPDSVIAQWDRVRSRMVRSIPGGFNREEWAFLIEFVEESGLRATLTDTFGERCDEGQGPLRRIARARASVAVWLPNNVTLLGPLLLPLLSLSGATLRIKGGSRTEDLTGSVLRFLSENLDTGELRWWIEHRVRYENFDHDDPRQVEMAASASASIVFGSDRAVAAVRGLERPLDAIWIPFSDRQSEAWIDRDELDDAKIDLLIKVFAIYGQAGCTSPRRVVIIDGVDRDAVKLRDRLASRWPSVIRRPVTQAVASTNIMARQYAASLGWDAVLTHGGGGVIASGRPDLEQVDAPMLLSVVFATAEEAARRLPGNIQTIGHSLRNPCDPGLLRLIARSAAKRFVPLAEMHHFGPLWDGMEFWRQLFEMVEVRL